MSLRKVIESMAYGMKEVGLEPGAIVCDPGMRAELARELEISELVPGGVRYLGLDVVVLLYHKPVLFVTSRDVAKELTTKSEVQRVMASAFSRLFQQ